MDEPPPGPGPSPDIGPDEEPPPQPETDTDLEPELVATEATLIVSGTIPPELWNRLGTKLIPKLRSADDLSVETGFTVKLSEPAAGDLESELQQILADLGLQEQFTIERQ